MVEDDSIIFDAFISYCSQEIALLGDPLDFIEFP